MRDAMPRVDDVGGNVDDALRVPVPVVAGIPVPRNDLAPRYQGVAWAPVSAGADRGRAVPTGIARAPIGVGLCGSGSQTNAGQADAARYHNSSYEPRNPVHGWFPSFSTTALALLLLSSTDRRAGYRSQQSRRPRKPRQSGRSETSTRSRTPGRDGAKIEARRWRWRQRRRALSLENVLSHIALPEIDVPVGVADIRVPNHWVHPKIAGLHRWIPRAPTTWAGWVVLRTAGPGT
jgi:hypothetical protein